MDINAFRVDKGGDPELIRESQRKRFAEVGVVDEVIELDKQWIKARFELDQVRKEFKQANKAVGLKKKEGGNAEDELAAAREIEGKLQGFVTKEKDLKSQLDAKVSTIGNFVHDSVIVSNDEKDNEIVVEHGECRDNEGCLTHNELLWMIGGYDFEHGAKIAGHRGYFFTDIGVALNQALVNYSLGFLYKRKYKLLQTPFMMNKDVMARVAQLSQFDEELYKVIGDDEKYLIATSEQPIAAFHLEERIDPKLLPIRYGGYSTCFRKEAGAHGRDTWGIFRVHQFEKIEQFCLTKPDESWEMHEEMLKTAEEFHQSLGLAYRVVNIVSGELNNAAAKKYDLEGWFPGLNTYRELVSCSNCTDYQSRQLDIKMMQPNVNVHMLNSTLCATGRVICCLLETYQTGKGINVPEPLQPYLAPYLEDPTFIPFVNNKPKKGKGKKK